MWSLIVLEFDVRRSVWTLFSGGNGLKTVKRKRELNANVVCFFCRFYLFFSFSVERGYYMVVRRYEFYFQVTKQYFTNELSEWVKYCFCHEKIKFISSSHRVMFFLLYRQNDIDKIIEGNYKNYVIDKLTCEIMENKPLGSRM